MGCGFLTVGIQTTKESQLQHPPRYVTFFLSFLNKGFRYDSVCEWVALASFPWTLRFTWSSRLFRSLAHTPRRNCRWNRNDSKVIWQRAKRQYRAVICSSCLTLKNLSMTSWSPSSSPLPRVLPRACKKDKYALDNWTISSVERRGWLEGAHSLWVNITAGAFESSPFHPPNFPLNFMFIVTDVML